MEEPLQVGTVALDWWDGEGGLVFITRGINNHSDDMFPVFEDEIVGIAIAVVW